MTAMADGVHLKIAAGPCVNTMAFDVSCGPETTQEQIYDHARGSVDAVLNGFNATIFA